MNRKVDGFLQEVGAYLAGASLRDGPSCAEWDMLRFRIYDPSQSAN
jgi:hypothetical protein